MIVAILFITPQMDEPIVGLAIGVLIGGALQVIIQLPSIIKKGYGWGRHLNFKQPEVIKIAKLTGPAIVGLAVYELNIMVDTLLASTLEEGSILGGFGSSVLEYLSNNSYNNKKVKVLGVPDNFIDHGKREELLDLLGLSKEKIYEKIKNDQKR